MAHDLRILIAEDDTWFLNKYLEILDEYVPGRFTIVDNGESLVNEFIRGKGEYGLVIADETIPYMNGIQAIEKMRLFERDNELDAVPMYLARADYRSVDAGDLQSGVTDVLKKPVQEDILMEILYVFLNIGEPSPSA